MEKDFPMMNNKLWGSYSEEKSLFLFVMKLVGQKCPHILKKVMVM